MLHQETEIEGCLLITPDVFEDHRGVFFESYSQATFGEIGIHDVFVQDNHSVSKAGVLRGLHFQYPPHAMSKLVRCTRGSLFDVVVDMRKTSPTFKAWVGVELSEENRQMLYIPEGCAHGFYALTDCELLYKCGALFDKTSDGGFRYDDPMIHVRWPLMDAGMILSERDQNQPSFSDILDKVNS
jgi:dTDP-4-dehydrorhamnose 3,5-epimerase